MLTEIKESIDSVLRAVRHSQSLLSFWLKTISLRWWPHHPQSPSGHWCMCVCLRARVFLLNPLSNSKNYKQTWEDWDERRGLCVEVFWWTSRRGVASIQQCWRLQFSSDLPHQLLPTRPIQQGLPVGELAVGFFSLAIFIVVLFIPARVYI